MASMKVSFLYIIQPNSQHARPLWLFQLELSIDWLIVRPLFCVSLSPEHNLSPEQLRSAAQGVLDVEPPARSPPDARLHD